MRFCFSCFLFPTDVNRKCWYVTTKGMHAVGQAEVVILLQCLPDEKTVPKDIFTHFVQLYQEALTGKSSSTTRPIGNKVTGPNSTVGEGGWVLCVGRAWRVLLALQSQPRWQPPVVAQPCLCFLVTTRFKHRR